MLQCLCLGLVGVYYGLDFPFSKLSKAKKLAAQSTLDTLEIDRSKYELITWGGGGWVSNLEGWVAKLEGWVAKIEGWVAKSVARQLATSALWVRIQTSLKNHQWAT